jgi:hypothetical protein
MDPVQTHYFSENMVAPGIEPGLVDGKQNEKLILVPYEIYRSFVLLFLLFIVEC